MIAERRGRPAGETQFIAERGQQNPEQHGSTRVHTSACPDASNAPVIAFQNVLLFGFQIVSSPAADPSPVRTRVILFVAEVSC